MRIPRYITDCSKSHFATIKFSMFSFVVVLHAKLQRLMVHKNKVLCIIRFMRIQKLYVWWFIRPNLWLSWACLLWICSFHVRSFRKKKCAEGLFLFSATSIQTQAKCKCDELFNILCLGFKNAALILLGLVVQGETPGLGTLVIPRLAWYSRYWLLPLRFGGTHQKNRCD